MNEIRVLASIKHRNIVRYCDAFVEKDSCVAPLRNCAAGACERPSMLPCRSLARSLARADAPARRSTPHHPTCRLYLAMEFAEHGDIGRQIEK